MKIFILIFLFSQFTFAQNQDECLKDAQEFGGVKGKPLISYNCLKLFQTMTPVFGKDENTDGSLKVWGQKNILFIEKISKDKKITLVNAGEYTLLQDIISVKLDSTHHEIAILQKNGDISFFSDSITGNVAPYRILRSKHLEDVNDILVDEKNDLILALNSLENEIVYFSRLANIDGPKNKKNLELVRSIEKIPGAPTHFSLDSVHRELFVLDSKNKLIYVYSLDNKSTHPPMIRMIKTNQLNKKATLMKYDPALDQIIITNSDKSLLKIPRNSL